MCSRSRIVTRGAEKGGGSVTLEWWLKLDQPESTYRPLLTKALHLAGKMPRKETLGQHGYCADVSAAEHLFGQAAGWCIPFAGMGMPRAESGTPAAVVFRLLGLCGGETEERLPRLLIELFIPDNLE